MTESFDAYHKWLGIPPKHQPPDHYRLLGLSLYESDPDVIDTAANRAAMYLRNITDGPHVETSQRILNEIAAARRCLLNEVQKRAYDTELKKKKPPKPKR